MSGPEVVRKWTTEFGALRSSTLSEVLNLESRIWNNISIKHLILGNDIKYSAKITLPYLIPDPYSEQFRLINEMAAKKFLWSLILLYKNDLYRFILNSDENASLTHKDAQNTFMASTFGKRRKTQVFLILTVPLANKKVIPSMGPTMTVGSDLQL